MSKSYSFHKDVDVSEDMQVDLIIGSDAEFVSVEILSFEQITYLVDKSIMTDISASIKAYLDFDADQYMIFSVKVSKIDSRWDRCLSFENLFSRDQVEIVESTFRDRASEEKFILNELTKYWTQLEFSTVFK
jgi:hypothetical protein